MKTECRPGLRTFATARNRYKKGRGELKTSEGKLKLVFLENRGFAVEESGVRTEEHVNSR